MSKLPNVFAKALIPNTTIALRICITYSPKTNVFIHHSADWGEM